MKYCYNCNRITSGTPLFCNFCARSYNVKLCPRKHSNPRKAEACSQCGSRDLSTPQPKVPWCAVIRELLDNPAALVSLALLMVPLAILWWMWSQIPAWFRKAIYRMLKRKREGEDRRRD